MRARRQIDRTDERVLPSKAALALLGAAVLSLLWSFAYAQCCGTVGAAAVS